MLILLFLEVHLFSDVPVKLQMMAIWHKVFINQDSFVYIQDWNNTVWQVESNNNFDSGDCVHVWIF